MSVTGEYKSVAAVAKLGEILRIVIYQNIRDIRVDLLFALDRVPQSLGSYETYSAAARFEISVVSVQNLNSERCDLASDDILLILVKLVVAERVVAGIALYKRLYEKLGVLLVP